MKFYITILLSICAFLAVNAQHDWDEVLYKVEINDVEQKNLLTISKYINSKFYLVTPQNKHIKSDYEDVIFLELTNADDFEDFYPFEVVDNDGIYYEGLIIKIEDEILYLETEDGEEEIDLYDIDEIINTILPSKILTKANNDSHNGKAISLDLMLVSLSAKEDNVTNSDDKPKALGFYPQINFYTRLKNKKRRHYYGVGLSRINRKVNDIKINMSALSFNYGMVFLKNINDNMRLSFKPGLEMVVVPLARYSANSSSNYDEWFPGLNFKFDIGFDYQINNSLALRGFTGIGRNVTFFNNFYRNFRFGVSLIYFRN